jgi:hypothetical protein
MRSYVVAVSTLLLFCSTFAVAQDVAKPQYSLKEENPQIGSLIRRDQVSGSLIALNLPYAKLPPQDKLVLHSWWESIPPNDEPPFPAGGMSVLLDPLRKVHAAILKPGDLFVVATVGKDGKVLEARVIEEPSREMGAFAARLMLLTSFKPAVCSGQPCSMQFPLRMKFTVSSW